MVTFKIEWKFQNGRRGSENVHTDPKNATDPVARAKFISRMSQTIVPATAKLVNWSIISPTRETLPSISYDFK